MKIGLIGCGKVGVTMFHLLKKNNQIVGVYDIDKRKEKRALQLLHVKKNVSLNNLCRESEALFFATPDDKLSEAYKRARSFMSGKKYLFHFSGLLSSKIFKKSRNAYRASVHPLATFPRIIIPPKRKKYFLFIEGDAQAKMMVRKIFHKSYFIIKNLSKKQKENYHLLGVFSSNLIVGLVSAIFELSKKMRWAEKDFYKILYPLIEETLDNIKKYKIKNALSGPIQRDDINIIRKHLHALRKNKNLSDTYKILSLNIINNVLKKKNEIERLLKM
jgi:predicted short-subunit dehydrogenase-like oxidoreductase (DUF2520 family)